MNFMKSHDGAVMPAKKINWPVFTGVLFLHLGAIPAFFCFSWPCLFLLIVLYWLSNGVGICLCYHRYLTHKGFEMPKALEYILAVLGTLTSQGGPISWVATHRCHHANSDKALDPHSPVQGFWWSHMLWFIYRDPRFEDPSFYEKYAPELSKDLFYRILGRFQWVPQTVLGVALLLWGGWPFVFWGIFLRTVLALHGAWLVNSAGHIWGYQSFKTKDRSRNNWWVAAISFGEGWHNNHHAFQRSARHGLRWWEIDLTFLTIKLLSFFNIISRIQIPDWRQSLDS